MRKFFNQAKDAIHKPDGHAPQQQPLASQPTGIHPPSPLDVMRYRYQHGANLGSIFVLEKWLTGGMYPENAQSAELAAVTGNIKERGLDATRAKFEDHWNGYTSDADLDWLMNEGYCNSLRLPIGYFTLGPAYCHGTPFESASAVYQNAWAAVKNLVSRCRARGIGVLIDLHAVPGGANGGDHSGTNSGKAEFWSHRSNLELATRCLSFIAEEAKHMDGVIGIQLCNEAEWDAKGMYKWYDSVISQMGSIDNTMPIYISDAWNLSPALSYCNGKNSLRAGAANPIVIDTHLYWAFSEDDKRKTPQQIAQEVHSKLSELNDHEGNVVDRGAVQVVVGEYSCVLTEDCWGKAAADQKGQLVREFGQAQSQRYQQRTGGSFFWTYRMDWMDGGEWGFKQQSKDQAITPPRNLTLSHQDVQSRIQNAQSQQQAKGQGTHHAHCQYWDNNHPGKYEHDRFQQGWQYGWSDAAAFFGMRANGAIPGPGGDKIGMLDIWVKKRIVESGQSGPFVWEFESGLRQGIKDFYELAGI